MKEQEAARSDRLGQPIGMYSHGFMTQPHGRMLYIAGQLAVGVAQELVGEGDFDAQMRQVFDNFGAVLEAAGLTFDHVVKFTTYLIDPTHIEHFYAVRESLFPVLFGRRAYPPNTLLVVQRLVRPEFMIEVEGIAHEESAPLVVTGITAP
jgi:enamine deaminase RidA (YjgF/YER057c/UK114 family)